MIMTFYFYVVEGVDRWNVDFLKMYKMEWWNFQDYALVLWPGLVPFLLRVATGWHVKQIIESSFIIHNYC